MEDWLRNGWLVEHRTSREEIGELLAVADRDVIDCREVRDWKKSYHPDFFHG